MQSSLLSIVLHLTFRTNWITSCCFLVPLQLFDKNTSLLLCELCWSQAKCPQIFNYFGKAHTTFLKLLWWMVPPNTLVLLVWQVSMCCFTIFLQRLKHLECVGSLCLKRCMDIKRTNFLCQKAWNCHDLMTALQWVIQLCLLIPLCFCHAQQKPQSGPKYHSLV